MAVRRDTRPVHRRPLLLLLVFLGGCAGTWARASIQAAWPVRPDAVPWSTLVINAAGSFLLALLLESLVHAGPDVGLRRGVRLAIGNGFLGAFTTYSTLSVETARRALGGQALLGAAYMLGSVVVGALLAVAAMTTVRAVVRGRS